MRKNNSPEMEKLLNDYFRRLYLPRALPSFYPQPESRSICMRITSADGQEELQLALPRLKKNNGGYEDHLLHDELDWLCDNNILRITRTENYVTPHITGCFRVEEIDEEKLRTLSLPYEPQTYLTQLQILTNFAWEFRDNKLIGIVAPLSRGHLALMQMSVRYVFSCNDYPEIRETPAEVTFEISYPNIKHDDFLKYIATIEKEMKLRADAAHKLSELTGEPWDFEMVKIVSEDCMWLDKVRLLAGALRTNLVLTNVDVSGELRIVDVKPEFLTNYKKAYFDEKYAEFSKRKGALLRNKATVEALTDCECEFSYAHNVYTTRYAVFPELRIIISYADADREKKRRAETIVELICPETYHSLTFRTIDEAMLEKLRVAKEEDRLDDLLVSKDQQHPEFEFDHLTIVAREYLMSYARDARTFNERGRFLEEICGYFFESTKREFSRIHDLDGINPPQTNYPSLQRLWSRVRELYFPENEEHILKLMGVLTCQIFNPAPKIDIEKAVGTLARLLDLLNEEKQDARVIFKLQHQIRSLALEQYTQELTALNFQERLTGIDSAIARIRFEYHEATTRDEITVEMTALLNPNPWSNANPPPTLKKEEASARHEAEKRILLRSFADRKPSFFGISETKASAARKFLSLLKNPENTTESFTIDEFFASTERHRLRNKNSDLRDAVLSAIGKDQLLALDSISPPKGTALVNIEKKRDGSFCAVVTHPPIIPQPMNFIKT